MKRRNVAGFLLLLGLVPLPGSMPRLQDALEVRVAFAQEGWRDEFDAVCAKTDVAMTLSRKELSERIDRCDRLRAKIEAEEESTRKVYLRRLQMCQDLYRFVLESKPPDR